MQPATNTDDQCTYKYTSISIGMYGTTEQVQFGSDRAKQTCCSSVSLCIASAGMAEMQVPEQPQQGLELEEGQAQEEHRRPSAARRTMDGSVDWHGNRCIKGKSGGWHAGFLILLNQALVTLATNGLSINLVRFMGSVMRLDNADAANHANNWNGTNYVFSIVGALISDSFWGRYKACIVFELILLAGLVELSISSYLFLHKYCDFGERQGEYCRPPTKTEELILYIAIYQIALGNGAYQPAVTTFGADQFDEADVKERKSKSAFFGYFFVANNLGSMVAVTALTYIEDKGGWVLAFWISTAAGFLGFLMFAMGTLRYRHFMPNGKAILSVCQVVVASVKNRSLKTPQRPEDLYELDETQTKNRARKMVHTPEYRCLDKAAVVKDLFPVLPGEHYPPNNKPWSLCSVTQVEEVKCILRLVPIWLCSILYSTAYSQMSSVFIEQAAAMDNSLSKSFKIPPAGISVFEIVGVTSFVFIYELCIVRLCSKISREPTELQRMGVGLVISTVAMTTAGLVEQQRLKHATDPGAELSSSLSILWQIPQYVLIGASEVFMYVTMNEFFNRELPEGLKSLGSALTVASMSAGNYASSLIVTLVMTITCRGNQAGWIPQDLNQGHVDRFFFVIAALNAMDLLVFLVLAKRYRRAPMIKLQEDLSELR